MNPRGNLSVEGCLSSVLRMKGGWGSLTTQALWRSGVMERAWAIDRKVGFESHLCY